MFPCVFPLVIITSPSFCSLCITTLPDPQVGPLQVPCNPPSPLHSTWVLWRHITQDPFLLYWLLWILQAVYSTLKMRSYDSHAVSEQNWPCEDDDAIRSDLQIKCDSNKKKNSDILHKNRKPISVTLHKNQLQRD